MGLVSEGTLRGCAPPREAAAHRLEGVAHREEKHAKGGRRTRLEHELPHGISRHLQMQMHGHRHRHVHACACACACT